jgi:uncharacterized LabA/DUF88 family protein
VKGVISEELDALEFRYYTGVKDGDRAMPRYLRYLDRIGFTTITKPLKKIAIGKDHPAWQLHGYTYVYKANFDVEMTVDILLERGDLDCVVLFSGDSDFADLARRLTDLGKSLVIYSSRKTLSWELKLACQEYRYLEDYREAFERL